MQVDATGLPSGINNGAARILSNDPAAADTAFHATLSAAGAPNLLVSTARLDFGSRFVGDSDTLAVIIAHHRGDPPPISAVAASPAGYTVLHPPVLLPPRGPRRARRRVSPA